MKPSKRAGARTSNVEYTVLFWAWKGKRTSLKLECVWSRSVVIIEKFQVHRSNGNMPVPQAWGETPKENGREPKRRCLHLATTTWIPAASSDVLREVPTVQSTRVSGRRGASIICSSAVRSFSIIWCSRPTARLSLNYRGISESNPGGKKYILNFLILRSAGENLGLI